MASTSTLAIGSTDSGEILPDFSSLSPGPFVARAGQGPVVADDSFTAAALSTATGLSMAQLILIALLGLILLASMGYAISRTSGIPPAAAA